MIAGLRKNPEYNKAQGIIQQFDPLIGRWLVGIGAKSVEDDNTQGQLWVRQPNVIIVPGSRPEDNDIINII